MDFLLEEALLWEKVHLLLSLILVILVKNVLIKDSFCLLQMLTETLMQRRIYTNLMKKQIHLILDELRVRKFSANSYFSLKL